ncbi:hypothetical protein GYN07_03605 [Rhizobium leguminosarum bv. viciae 248]|uniref:hypothetical protein n=1 Tax=Rhizobium leguminosarum TaxID=384 RepID=UPI00036AAF0A|nr:hypothetical protein [Rhizobium leguminosarum]MCA2410536.1 hypothetical protein [Rhizobium leguminosarum]NKM64481.1 hypothetical protein [Rhizobium leguminosarum bv. viciae]QHW23482.1 hypothetical protein GYN07_03605 [Rhizobium leguminosarum bv. viciae 248]
MADLTPLWHATFRKETMDLLAQLWTTLDADGCETLATELLKGPPDALFEHIEDLEEREASRDRRLFDRIVVLERVQDKPLTEELKTKMKELRARYPVWRAAPGEQAHFGSWFTMRWARDTDLSADSLIAMSDDELMKQLAGERDELDGFLVAWRDFVIAQPERGLQLLERVARSPDPGSAEIWEYGLWGLRDSKMAGSKSDQIFGLLTEVPDKLFDNSDFVHSAADMLEAKSRTFYEHPATGVFWRLFDRVLGAVGLGHDNDQEIHDNWVEQALNRPIGKLATAFINALFSQKRQVGEGIPNDLAVRADRLMAPGSPGHRPARVVGASRISYLYAIDPDWTGRTLVPCFDWSNEEESVAVWQGYAWQARIDPQLWPILKPHFLPLFQTDRLERMGQFGQSIAQTLMLVGVAFDPEELKRDEVRNAIRAMPSSLRENAAAWIAGYMMADASDVEEDEEPIDGSPDTKWRQRIAPWLKRVWPAEQKLRAEGVAEQFALAAIATSEAFPEAVAIISEHAVKTKGSRVVRHLQRSAHPDRHPAAALELLDKFVDRHQQIYFDKEEVDILQRIKASDGQMADDNRFRDWIEHLSARRQLGG